MQLNNSTEVSLLCSTITVQHNYGAAQLMCSTILKHIGAFVQILKEFKNSVAAEIRHSH
jgi:hypothetical protein